MKRNPQTEVTKSALAATVAIVMIGLTWLVYRLTQPSIPDAFVKVGQAFFEMFETGQVSQMELAAVDKSGKALSFSVRKTNGLWTIPSHYDYPAEAVERLGRTTSELIGLERRTLASSEKGAQALLGTLDPTSEEGKADPENAGKLLRFTDSNGEPVFELIVGKQVEQKTSGADSLLGLEEPEERMFYVRVPSEKDTYTAKLDLDISTQFSDWIEADLLELNAAEMRQVNVDNSRLEARQVMTNQGIEVRRVRVPGEELKLQKADDFSEWILPDLNQEQETMNAEAVNPLIRTIEAVELIGVRPRHKYQGRSVLDGNLEFQFPAEVANDIPAQQTILDELQDDLLSRGFGLSQDPESNQIKLVSEHGQLSTTTKDGLVYTLYFGSQIVGSEESIEIGAADAKPEPQADPAKEDDPHENPPGDKPNPAEQATARFLLVRVEHRPELMSDRPVAPQEPEPLVLPEGVGEPANDAATPPPEATGEQKEQVETGQSGDDQSADGSDSESAESIDNGSVQSQVEQPGLPVKLATFSQQDQTPPVQQETPPVQEQTPPAQEQTPPAQEQTPPAQEQTPPAQEQTPPAQEQTPPVQEQTPPVQEQTPPAEGAAPPVQGESASSTEGAQDPTTPPTTPEKGLSREDMQKALDAEFEQKKQAFADQKLQYELDVKEFESRTKNAAEKAKRLSERFADWYYVVPSSDLDRLRLTRAEVVKPKDIDATNPLGLPPGIPPGFQFPGGLPPSQLPNQ